MSENVPATAKPFMELLKGTPTVEIMKLDYVKNRFVSMFNLCNRSDMGEIAYTRNLLHISGVLSKMAEVNTIDKLSVVNCILKIAEKGVSADPQDKELYLVPRKGVLCIQPQEQFYTKGLINTKQIAYAQKAELVYQGDTFMVSKGRVIEHIRLFKSERIIAGYKIFVLNDGINERHFVYYPEHWEVWRAAAPQPNGANWRAMRLEEDGKTWTPTGQPKVPFLETKIGTHAAQSNVWSTTAPPPSVEVIGNVILTDDEIEYSEEIPANSISASSQQTTAGNSTAPPVVQISAATIDPAAPKPAAPSFIKPQPAESTGNPF